MHQWHVHAHHSSAVAVTWLLWEVSDLTLFLLQRQTTLLESMMRIISMAPVAGAPSSSSSPYFNPVRGPGLFSFLLQKQRRLVNPRNHTVQVLI